MSTTTTPHTQTAYKDTPIGKIPADWEVKTLGELGIFSKGKGILKDQVKEKGLPCIRYGEIYTSYDYVAQEFKSFIDEDVAKASKEINKGDVLFAGSGETVDEIGKSVAYLGELKAYAGGDVIVYSPNQDLVSSECLSYTLDLNSVRKQKRYMGQGNSVVHIYPSDLAKLQIPLPPLPEQKRIAEVLSTWDKAIQLTEQLIRQKEQRKKWLMQNLLTGKMRLKGFSGEWKEMKIGECGEFFKGAGISKNEVKDSGFYAIRYGEIYTKHHYIVREIQTYISQESALLSKEIRKGDILFASSGETAEEIGKCATYLFDDIAYAGGDIIVFRPKESYDSIFLGYLFNSDFVNSQKSSLAKGHSVVHIYPKDLAIVKIFIPSIEEQTAIAEILQTADKEIELLKAKAEKLKEQKKGLMQQLLTGKKRLL